MLRDPPHNIEAEQALLGAILVNNQAIHRVTEFLNADHFYNPLHGLIYEASHRIISSNRRATPITLKTEFQDQEPEGDLTVPQYLGRLAASATTIAGIEDYGRTVYDLARRRRLVEIGEAMIVEAFDAAIDYAPENIIETTEAELAALAERGRSQEYQLTSADAATQAINSIAAAYQRDGAMSGLPTGLVDLDHLTGGLAPGDLFIAAGRPGMGKSAIAAGTAYHNAQLFMRTRDSDDPQGCPVGFFTLEMSASQIVQRQIAYEVKIPASKMRRGDIAAEDFDRILDVCSASIANAPIYFDEAGGITIAQIAARARRMKRKHKIGLLVVDYLQLISGGKGYRGNRTAEITEITTGLKSLAKELEIPVMALSQLSREVEKREGCRPQLSDLRESGSIEQDADVVMFVFREEYYLRRREPDANTAQHFEWQNELSKVHGKAELMIEKQRQGPTGKIEVQFSGPLTRFSDLAQQEMPEAAE